jgi:hypothetical protein
VELGLLLELDEPEPQPPAVTRTMAMRNVASQKTERGILLTDVPPQADVALDLAET